MIYRVVIKSSHGPSVFRVSSRFYCSTIWLNIKATNIVLSNNLRLYGRKDGVVVKHETNKTNIKETANQRTVPAEVPKTLGGRGGDTNKYFEKKICRNLGSPETRNPKPRIPGSAYSRTARPLDPWTPIPRIPESLDPRTPGPTDHRTPRSPDPTSSAGPGDETLMAISSSYF
jgi:hypothetical protein